MHQEINMPMGRRVSPLPGDVAIWLFIYAELLVFGAMFLAFAVARRNHAELFHAEQLLLDRSLGLINTIILICSSYSAAQAVAAAHANRMARVVHCLLLTLAFGAAFIVLKLYEFAQDAAHGFSLSRNLFDMFYLLLTGFHFLHVLMGLVIIAYIALKAARGGYHAQAMAGIETGVSYWHMVDMVWIILFALVYVIH